MTRLSLVATAALVALAACTSEPDVPATAGPVVDSTAAPRTEASDEYAVATLAPLGDASVAGDVQFIGLDGAVEIRYNLTGLTPGAHGFHVHETGDCGADSTGAPGSAAGGHFNPMASPHGAPSAVRTARHAGDLGNITPDADGHAVGTVVDSVLAFTGPTSVLGKAFIVHAGADDLTSQPSGDAGDRVGCGVIRERAEGPMVP